MDEAPTHLIDPCTHQVVSCEGLAEGVLSSAVELARSHWASWSTERLRGTFQGKVAVVGVMGEGPQVVAVGLLDTPVDISCSTGDVTRDAESHHTHLQLATATFVIVDPSMRGKGLGRALMKQLEDVCTSRYRDPPVCVGGDLRATVRKCVDGIALRTDSQVAFYTACGFRRGRTQQLVAERACFKNVKQAQLDGLASLFAARGREVQRRVGEQTIRGADPSDSVAGVWMIKVLREEFPEPFVAPLFPTNHISSSINGSDVGFTEAARQVLDGGSVYSILEGVFPLPWQRQLGPSCGLAVLRMLREHRLGGREAALPSLSQLYLSVAASDPAFYTELAPTEKECSTERQPPALGEVLSVDLLKHVADAYLGSAAGLTFEVVSVDAVRANGYEEGRRVWYAIPYDRSSSEAPSTDQGGHRAHWCIAAPLVAPLQRDPCVPLMIFQHGASRCAMVATADELTASNQQLRQVVVTCQETGQPRQASLGGLRGRCMRVSVTL